MPNPIPRTSRLACALNVFSMLALTFNAAATNYDETKVGNYALPDPLICANGSRVTNSEVWKQKRRAEILELYRRNIFGHSPEAGTNITFNIWDTATNALGGTATRKQMEINFSGAMDGPLVHVLLYTPAGKTNCPMFLCLSFGGNHTVSDDPAIAIFPEWNWKTKKFGMPQNFTRGSGANNWKISETLARGYGIAFVNYNEIEPDLTGGAGLKFGVRKNFPAPATNDWGAIGAWAWGASRVLDYLQTDKDVDAQRVILFGFSRLGKTALWAGAQDTRFAAVISHCSGEMGASLSRRDFGETVDDVAKRFPYWMSGSFIQFSNNWNTLPVDAHSLLALVAPRPLLINTGDDDRWSDPNGQFLAARAASPVYELFGKIGITETNFPPLDQPLKHDIWFNCHKGKHEILPSDWDLFLNFADAHIGQK